LTHDISNIKSELLKKYDYKIIKCSVEQQFIQIASIEAIFKVYSKKIFRNLQGWKSIVATNPQKYKFQKLKYWIDLYLVENSIEITDKNRANFLHKKCLDWEKESGNVHRLHLAKQDEKIYKIFNYSDVFINKKYDIFYEIDPQFDPVLYENFLQKTWLPDKIELFGEEFYPKDYGYSIHDKIST
jgi:hypothetical protein